jgi:hypothetical protein
MTTIGLVLIFFALAAYRSVFTVSLTLDRAGEMHAIWKHGSYIVTISINVPSIPTSPNSFTATFADNIAVVATDSDPATASQQLQTTRRVGNPGCVIGELKLMRLNAHRSM